MRTAGRSAADGGIMVWRLEIRNIGLDRKGDATLIRAINDGVGPNQAQQYRSVLIDGGLNTDSARVDGYLATALVDAAGNALPLDVIVVTHYDIDHFRGVTDLLNLPGTPRYNNTIIFDQGFSVGSSNNAYRNYVAAIASRGQRSRVTGNVLGLQLIPFYPPAPAGGWEASETLLGDEIMWTNTAGAARTPAALLGAAAGTNLNQPTITCIAVNQYVVPPHGQAAVRHGGAGADLRNQHSLGFIVQFNNFKFYIAGDLERAQEDAATELNAANDLAGRVSAIHASHHGGVTSTSRAFLNRLKPAAA